MHTEAVCVDRTLEFAIISIDHAVRESQHPEVLITHCRPAPDRPQFARIFSLLAARIAHESGFFARLEPSGARVACGTLRRPRVGCPVV